MHKETSGSGSYGELLAIAAEARIYRKGNVCYKYRIPKGYRHPKLDERIRKERTKREFRLMQKMIKAKLPIPLPISRSDYTIEMEFIEGKPLSKLEFKEEFYEEIAKIIADLHNLGIYHGDLSPYNFIKREKLYLIDFGLSDYGNIEDFAVDLKVLRDTFSVVFKEFNFEKFKEFYKKYARDSDLILKRLDIVDSRGRYK